MGVTVTWEGIGAAAGALDGLVARVKEASRSGVEEGGQMVQDQARANIGAIFRVQTGALAASTYSRMSGEYEATIAPHVIYGRHQELGGPSVGRPWLRFPGVGGSASLAQRAMAGHAEGGRSSDAGYIFVHSVMLPARPYLAPALEAETMPWYDVMVARWTEAWSV